VTFRFPTSNTFETESNCTIALIAGSLAVLPCC
jgi:hypothetical protein